MIVENRNVTAVKSQTLEIPSDPNAEYKTEMTDDAIADWFAIQILNNIKKAKEGKK